MIIAGKSGIIPPILLLRGRPMKNGGWNATRPVPALFHLPTKLSLPEMKVLPSLTGYTTMNGKNSQPDCECGMVDFPWKAKKVYVKSMYFRRK
jgi:hypothetical protein